MRQWRIHYKELPSQVIESDKLEVKGSWFIFVDDGGRYIHIVPESAVHYISKA